MYVWKIYDRVKSVLISMRASKRKTTKQEKIKGQAKLPICTSICKEQAQSQRKVKLRRRIAFNVKAMYCDHIYVINSKQK